MKNSFYYLTNHLNNILKLKFQEAKKFRLFSIYSLSSLLFNKNINIVETGSEANCVVFLCHSLS